MSDAGSPERAFSFGTIADTYDRYRPGPSAAVAAWVLPAGAADVLDLGAGTGAFTRQLVGRVAGLIVAAEPDRRMQVGLARCRPQASPVGARAERLPFAAASLDAVLVSSAWHWMDAGLTVPEIARVLRPGGCFGVLWSGPDRRVEWVADLLGRLWESPDTLPDAPAYEDHRHQVVLPAGAPFGPPATTTLTWTSPMMRHELVGLAATYSQVIVLPEAERNALLGGVAERAAALIPIGGPPTIEIPMRCRCWRANRLPR